MKTYSVLYYRDDSAVTYNEWLNKLNADIAAVQAKNPCCPIAQAVMGDIDRGLTSVVNQHTYKQVIIQDVKVVL